VTLREETTRQLHRIVLDRQRKHRISGVFAGVVRSGGLVWHTGVGAARLDEPEAPPGPDDQFLIASNTKTFTAVMLMQLRDEDRLSLDDTLDRHVPGLTRPGPTIRQSLAHVSGMQREPVGDVWEHLVFPDREQLLSGFNEAERVHRPHYLWHYSNLVYSLLGEVVARLDGRDWAESRRARRGLLRPAVHRRPGPPARQRPRRDGPVRRAGEHRGGPGPLVGVRRRPAGRGVVSGHAG
jgi:CubicO group peptidase (beta-lactamase class C family)